MRPGRSGALATATGAAGRSLAAGPLADPGAARSQPLAQAVTVAAPSPASDIPVAVPSGPVAA